MQWPMSIKCLFWSTLHHLYWLSGMYFHSTRFPTISMFNRSYSRCNLLSPVAIIGNSISVPTHSTYAYGTLQGTKTEDIPESPKNKLFSWRGKLKMKLFQETKALLKDWNRKKYSDVTSRVSRARLIKISQKQKMGCGQGNHDFRIMYQIIPPIHLINGSDIESVPSVSNSLKSFAQNCKVSESLRQSLIPSDGCDNNHI